MYTHTHITIEEKLLLLSKLEFGDQLAKLYPSHL